MTKLKIGVRMPSKDKPTTSTLEKDDIFNKDSKYVVAHSGYGGYNNNKARSNNKCPIFKTYIPYKSITLKCKESELDSVIYWCEYVHGGGCISKIKNLNNKYVAIRSDYMCW